MVNIKDQTDVEKSIWNSDRERYFQKLRHNELDKCDFTVMQVLEKLHPLYQFVHHKSLKSWTRKRDLIFGDIFAFKGNLKKPFMFDAKSKFEDKYGISINCIKNFIGEGFILYDKSEFRVPRENYDLNQIYYINRETFVNYARELTQDFKKDKYGKYCFNVSIMPSGKPGIYFSINDLKYKKNVIEDLEYILKLYFIKFK